MYQTDAKTKKLHACHHRAVELRYLGKTYGEIAEVISKELDNNYQEPRVRRWFGTGGIVENEYKHYSEQENNRRRQLISNHLYALLPRIPELIEAILNRKDRFGNDVLDMLTVRTLKFLVDLLDLKVREEDYKPDPMESWFEFLENEREKHNQKPIEKPLN